MPKEEKLKELEEHYESLDLRVRSLERWVNKLTKHSHTIESQETGEVVI